MKCFKNSKTKNIVVYDAIDILPESKLSKLSVSSSSGDFKRKDLDRYYYYADLHWKE